MRHGARSLIYINDKRQHQPAEAGLFEAKI
jgi:hypothetical protein